MATSIQKHLGGRIDATAAFYAAFLIITLWLLALSPSLVGKPVTLFGAAPEGLSPDVAPRLVLIGFAVLAAAGLVSALRRPGAVFGRPSGVVIVTCGISFAFAILLVPLGFVLASAATVAGLALFLGARRPIALAICAGGIPLGVYLVFTRLLHVSLPASPIGF